MSASDKETISKNTAAIKLELDQLRREIAHHDTQYFTHDNPDIPDADYDRLFARLVT